MDVAALMTRPLVLVVVMGLGLGSRSSFADDRCTTTPGFGDERALSLVLADVPMFGGHMFAPADEKSHFPAVSSDGTTLVELFTDTEDFTGAAITTLVFWSTSTGKRSGELQLGGSQAGVGERKNEAAMLARANARLARSKWRGVSEFAPCDDDKGVAAAWTLKVPASIHFNWKTQQVQLGARRFAFPSPGTGNREVGGGACGKIAGFARAFGTAKLVVVVPQISLGGDSCFGSPLVDLAIAVRP